MAGQVAKQYETKAGAVKKQTGDIGSAFGGATGQIGQQTEAIAGAGRTAQEAVEKAGTSGFQAEDIAKGGYFPTQDVGTYYRDVQAPDYLRQLAEAQKLESFTQQAPSMQTFEQSLAPVGGTGYTGGERALDALILARTPGVARQYTSDIQEATGGLSDVVRGQQALSQAQITGEGATSLKSLEDAERARIGGLITGAETKITDTLAGRETTEEARRLALEDYIKDASIGNIGITDASIIEGLRSIGQYRGDNVYRPQTATTAQYMALQDRLQEERGSGTMTLDPEMAERLGLSAQTETYGVRPEDYLNIQKDVDPIQLAEQEDFNRATALAELAGRGTQSVVGSGWGEGLPGEVKGLQDYLDAIAKAKQPTMSTEELHARMRKLRSTTYKGVPTGH